MRSDTVSYHIALSGGRQGCIATMGVSLDLLYAPLVYRHINELVARFQENTHCSPVLWQRPRAGEESEAITRVADCGSEGNDMRMITASVARVLQQTISTLTKAANAW